MKRGADIVAQSLARLGCKRVFTLSGNHIMSLFDAAIEAKLETVHVRHEAAAVHMADAWGRLTGGAGIALVTGGPGHANAVGALFTALAAESPMVLLSGHAATWELGRGGFQELRQADMAAPVTKASWTAKSAATLGRDIGDAIRLATSGRPGPVHVSLPSDLLDETVSDNAIVWPEASNAIAAELTAADADTIIAAIASAARPIVLAGPQFSNSGGRALLARLETATNVPAVVIESPRGMADATLGGFAGLAKRADLVVLLKALDFTIKWAAPPTFDAELRLIAVDPDAGLLKHAAKEKGERLLLGCVAEGRRAAEMLITRAVASKPRDGKWLAEARSVLQSRPEAWAALVSQTARKLHPAEVFRALHPFIERDADTILICDGGEFAQWAYGMLPVRHRLINGVAGAIGCSIPFALAARLHEKRAPVFAILGDGTIGFHIAEFETALRCGLPFVAIVGNDARWNAESQIQLRSYGRERMHGCELLPVRYDQLVAALGGHGELVERAADLPGAIERALASGKPACINVMIESVASPAVI
jgi:acetolactate synthase-1/2/3 large subunit